MQLKIPLKNNTFYNTTENFNFGLFLNSYFVIIKKE